MASETHARDAFFLLRGLTGASLPASAPVSLAGGGGLGVAFAGEGTVPDCMCEAEGCIDCG